MLKRVYISGPITGMPSLNKDAFDGYADRLAQEGTAFFNPHTISAPSDPLEGQLLWQYYMRACVKQIPDCTEIHLLPGWEDSSGAQWEKDIAEMLGLKVIFNV